MKNKNKRQKVLALLNQKQGVSYKFLAEQIYSLSEETLDQLLLIFGSDDQKILLEVVVDQDVKMKKDLEKLTELSNKFDALCRRLKRKNTGAAISKSIKE
jgi:hypothetical protein